MKKVYSPAAFINATNSDPFCVYSADDVCRRGFKLSTEICPLRGDMLDRLDAALRFQQEALNLRAQRREVLAANIANADTPVIRRVTSILPVN